MNLRLELAIIPDLELLEKLCSTQEDQELYAEFVSRFVEEVVIYCCDICKKRNIESHVGKQIAHDVFERVRKYKSFKADEIKIPNHRTAILVYLKRISISLFNNFHNENKRTDIIHKTYFDDIFESVEKSPDALGLKDKKDFALFIFGRLNKKEQTVILADIEHKKFQKYLPDDITQNLSAQLGVKKESIRKIRERAIEKIKKAINEFNEK
ncbi:hypothetical protein SIO70_02925 [Chitinophaga sancti]|uniref:RNA polymerase sigma factor n=1 Tax=Chitinophaga sancti TaxID=1004 RepID=UPI002A75F62D|nr:hypothetical protein [Chitinophaga sancti]WPQ63811.1 hypothetical protein SIO70_02925 [Chitinophaga sancti]